MIVFVNLNGLQMINPKLSEMALKSGNFGGNKMNKWGYPAGFYNKGRENSGPRSHSRFNKGAFN